MFFLQMSGFPGSGKSTLAKLIAKETKAVIVDHDIGKSAMLQSLKRHGEHIVKTGPVSYDIDWALINFYLAQDYSVIFDAPCLYDEMIDKGLSLSSQYGVSYKYIEVYLNDRAEINHRLRTRERLISQIAEVTSEESFQQALKLSKKPQNVSYLNVDSSKPIESYLPEVIAYIKGE